MSPEEYVLTVTALAIAISEDATTDEVRFLAGFFGQLGVTLGSIAARRDACSPKKETTDILVV